SFGVYTHYIEIIYMDRIMQAFIFFAVMKTWDLQTEHHESIKNCGQRGKHIIPILEEYINFFLINKLCIAAHMEFAFKLIIV
ncbi:hypothetical protein ACJX0J_030095, partial [Zea mays]